jgi:uncharacterized membrane protein YhiD involved in acid resistance
MRQHHGLRTLAAVTTAAAIAAPAAQAKYDYQVYRQVPTPAVTQHHTGNPTDWTLIAVGATGAIALIGAGTATSRRRTHRSAQARAASGS